MHRIKISLLIAVALVMGGCSTQPAAGDTYAEVSIGASGSFYDALAPYGIWVTIQPYGQCWVPNAVGPDWAPYTVGNWVYSDYGWTWVDDEPWGWAPFHYGRWAYSDDYGWFWVPGTTWGPAWVAWREGDDCIGWAPLPPGPQWEVGIGFAAGFDFGRDIPAQGWCFVNDRDMVRHHVYRYAFPPERRDAFIRTSRDVTRYASVNDRVMDRGIDPQQVAHWTGRPVTHVRVTSVATRGPARTVVRGNVVQMPRPAVRPGGSAWAPTRRSVPPAVMAQRAQEFRQMNQRQTQERQQMEARYRQEMAAASAERRASMERQLASERQSLAAHQAQERAAMAARQQRQYHPAPGSAPQPRRRR